jgi:transcriptional regulator with XRE-family HTH domain
MELTIPFPSAQMRPMEIDKRLRQLRQAKGLSQGDIERRSGLLRSYISRVEGGYTVPSLATLEKWAVALEIQPYQLLFDSRGHPSAVKVSRQPELSTQATRLVKLLDRMSSTSRRVLLNVASKLAKD